MNGKNWRLCCLVLLLLLITTLVARWVLPGEEAAPEPYGDDLRAYLPALPGAVYAFQGSGNEFAAFMRRITFAESGLVQLEDASGTNLALVVEHHPQKLTVIWSEEEFYEEESLLDAEYRASRGRGHAVELVLLSAPLVVGHTWSDQRFQREIVAVDQVVAVPLGVFYDVVVVKSTNPEAPEMELYEYYAKNVGLIKRESLFPSDGKTYSVVSSLRSFSCPLSQ